MNTHYIVGHSLFGDFRRIHIIAFHGWNDGVTRWAHRIFAEKKKTHDINANQTWWWNVGGSLTLVYRHVMGTEPSICYRTSCFTIVSHHNTRYSFSMIWFRKSGCWHNTQSSTPSLHMPKHTLMYTPFTTYNVNISLPASASRNHRSVNLLHLLYSPSSIHLPHNTTTNTHTHHVSIRNLYNHVLSAVSYRVCV